MALFEFGGIAPQLGSNVWVAESAQVIGQVFIGENASVWYGTVVRGDTEQIRIGSNSNIQDLSVLHADFGVPLVVGEHVTVGHQAMLHGCTIGDGSMIGIQAVVLNNAKIGRNSIVGAGSVVTEGKEFPDNSLIVGTPAKVVRTLNPDQIAKLRANSQEYVANAKRHSALMKLVV